MFSLLHCTSQELLPTKGEVPHSALGNLTTGSFLFKIQKVIFLINFKGSMVKLNFIKTTKLIPSHFTNLFQINS